MGLNMVPNAILNWVFYIALEGVIKKVWREEEWHYVSSLHDRTYSSPSANDIVRHQS